MSVVCVWRDVDYITMSWHDGGGVVVVADSVEQAMALVPRIGNHAEPVGQPDHVWTSNDAEPGVIIFPDAGCC